MTDPNNDRPRAKKPAGKLSVLQVPAVLLEPAVFAPAHLARTAAREKLQTAQTALERAQRVANESAAEAERHANAMRAADRAHVAAVEAWIANGCAGQRPERAVDRTLADADAAAQAEHRTSSAALASLQATHDLQQAELAEADERLRSAVVDIVLREAAQVANEIVELEERALELRLELVGIIDHPLILKRHDVYHGGKGVPYEISRGLYRPRPTRESAFFLPRYAPELIEQNMVACGQARQRWLERIAELLGESIESRKSDPRRSDPQAEVDRLIVQAVSQAARS